jgi:excisionase family DNA binding protein
MPHFGRCRQSSRDEYHHGSVRALEPLLTIRQAVDLMQVSEKTVRRRITDGSLIALRIGSQRRIQRCDLQASCGNRRSNDGQQHSPAI